MRNLRALFRLIRISNIRVTTLQYNNRHRIRHNRVIHRLILHISSIIRFNKRRQPSTIEGRRIPLFNLLNRRRRHLVRILRLHTSTRRQLNLLSVTTAFPRSRKTTFNLTLNLKLNNLSRKVSITFRSFQLRSIRRTTRILRRRSLTSPLLHNNKGQRTTNLRNTKRLFTNNKRRLTRRLSRALMYTSHFLFKVRKNFMPNNILHTSNMFTRFSHTVRLLNPFLRLIHSKVNKLLNRARVHNQVHKRSNSLYRVLSNLMYKRTPFLTSTIRITRVTNRTKARARRLVQGLIRAQDHSTKLRASYNCRLAISYHVNTIVNSIRRLTTRLINHSHLRRATLLINSTQRMRRTISTRRTAKNSYHNLINHITTSHTIRRGQVPKYNRLHHMSSNIIGITGLMFTVKVNIRQAMFKGLHIFRHIHNFLIPNRHIRSNITYQTLKRLISSLTAFRRRLQKQIRRTTRSSIAFSFRVKRGTKHTHYSNHRRHKHFKNTTFMVQAVRRLNLIRYRIIFARRNNRNHIRARSSNRHSSNTILSITTFLTRFSQVRRRQRLITFPGNRTSRRKRFTSSTSATFHIAIIRRTFRAPTHNTRRTIISRRQIRNSISFNRRLHSTQ